MASPPCQYWQQHVCHVVMTLPVRAEACQSCGYQLPVYHHLCPASTMFCPNSFTLSVLAIAIVAFLSIPPHGLWPFCPGWTDLLARFLHGIPNIFGIYCSRYCVLFLAVLTSLSCPTCPLLGCHPLAFEDYVASLPLHLFMWLHCGNIENILLWKCRVHILNQKLFG